MPARLAPTGILTVANGGTSAATAATALTNLGAAALAGATFTGPVLIPTAVPGDNSTNAASTAFTAAAFAAVASISITGGSTTLTAVQYQPSAMVVTGALTSNATLVVPNSGNWIVSNRTSGAYSLIIKTAGGTGMTVSQGLSDFLLADGTNVVLGNTDFANVAIRNAAIDSTPIGASTPSTGAFTSLSATATASNFGTNANTSTVLTINGAAGSFRNFNFTTAGVARCNFGVTNDAETGGSAGSLFFCNVFNDSGTYVGNGFLISRVDASMTLNSTTINGNLLVSGGYVYGTMQFANAKTFTDPDAGVTRDAKFGQLGIAVRGGIKTDTLTATTPIALNSGGTGAATAAAALTNLGAAALSGAAFTGAVTVPTPTAGDSSTNAASTAYTAAALAAVASISITGGTTTLTAAQYISRAVIVTGALTSNATIVVPNSGNWIMSNRTTGAFTVTVKTSAGTGAAVAQGFNNYLLADGTNVVIGDTDFSGVVVPVGSGGTGATTASVALTNLGAAALAGATFTGNVVGPYGYFTSLTGVTSFVVGSTTLAQSSNINIVAAASQNKQFTFQTAGSARWTLGTTATAEPGSNVGCDFALSNWTDAGAFLSSPLTITRSTGQTTLTSLAVSGAATAVSVTVTGYEFLSTATGLSAAGTTQATALALTKQINVITTTASGSGAALPNAGVGVDFIVINRGANALLLYPPSGGTIDALAANAGTSVATLTTKRITQVSATQYYSS